MTKSSSTPKDPVSTSRSSDEDDEDEDYHSIHMKPTCTSNNAFNEKYNNNGYKRNGRMGKGSAKEDSFDSSRFKLPRRSVSVSGPFEISKPGPRQSERNNGRSKILSSSMSISPVSHLRDSTGCAPGGLKNERGRRRASFTVSKEVAVGDEMRANVNIFDTPAVVAAYESVPKMEVEKLPRGGLSLETQAVGRIQFGIPPETIKDSMQLGLSVPSVYIVPTERFCRDMGPALGVNLAEFEFPAYFNYFVHGKQCTLIVDRIDAEENIRKVFEETLLGPAEFRNNYSPVINRDEDFSPSFPLDARPNFSKEFQWFRKNEATDKYDELQLDMLLTFKHFNKAGSCIEKLGIPPIWSFELSRNSALEDDNEMKTKDDTFMPKDSSDRREDGNSKGFRRTRSASDLLLDSSDHGGDNTKDPVSRKERLRSCKSSSDNDVHVRLKSDRRLRISLGSKSPSVMLPEWSDDEDEQTNWTFSQLKWLGKTKTSSF